MSRTKIIIFSIVSICLIAVVGLSVFYLYSRDINANKKSSAISQNSESSNSDDNLSATNSPGISQSPGINVQSQNGNNESGQILPNQDNGQRQPDPAALLDPKTFPQYDKYKNSSGAYFIDLKVGTGDSLTSGKKALVYYKGWLTNGKVFDMSQSDKDGQLLAYPFTMGAHQVIAGWEQGLNGMKADGVRLLIVPPAAGYGATAHGPIPANSVLVFQVQLLAVQ